MAGVRGRTREELIEKCAGIIQSDLLSPKKISERANSLAELLIELTGNTGTEPIQRVFQTASRD
jgi:uncharacterized membrane protein YheB (UPF0754 family)